MPYNEVATSSLRWTTKRLILGDCSPAGESFGPAFDTICDAVSGLSNRGDVQIGLAGTSQSQVKASVESAMRNKPNVLLSGTLDYVSLLT